MNEPDPTRAALGLQEDPPLSARLPEAIAHAARSRGRRTRPCEWEIKTARAAGLRCGTLGRLRTLVPGGRTHGLKTRASHDGRGLPPCRRPGGHPSARQPAAWVIVHDSVSTTLRCAAVPLSNDEYNWGIRVSNTTVNLIAAPAVVPALWKSEHGILVLLILARMLGSTNPSPARVRA